MHVVHYRATSIALFSPAVRPTEGAVTFGRRMDEGATHRRDNRRAQGRSRAAQRAHPASPVGPVSESCRHLRRG